MRNGVECMCVRTLTCLRKDRIHMHTGHDLLVLSSHGSAFAIEDKALGTGVCKDDGRGVTRSFIKVWSDISIPTSRPR
jgi:hypothetical protein